MSDTESAASDAFIERLEHAAARSIAAMDNPLYERMLLATLSGLLPLLMDHSAEQVVAVVLADPQDDVAASMGVLLVTDTRAVRAWGHASRSGTVEEVEAMRLDDLRSVHYELVKLGLLKGWRTRVRIASSDTMWALEMLDNREGAAQELLKGALPTP